ncbi:MAG: hypothetical protein ACR2GF_01710 [Acidimicrobiales bacterium]
MAGLAGCSGSGSNGQASPTTTSPAATTPGAAATQFCSLSRVFYDRVTSLSNDLSADPTRVRRFVDALVTVAKQAADAAPAQISADAKILTDAATAYAHDLENAGYDATRVAPEAAARLSRPEVTDASRRVQEYETATCGARP